MNTAADDRVADQAATPAAPPPTAAGRAMRRNSRPRSPERRLQQRPCGRPATPSPSARRADGGDDRNDARRSKPPGNRSSVPAVARTSAVRSARITSRASAASRAARAGRRRGSGLRREGLQGGAPAVPVQDEHRQREADERDDDRDPRLLPGDDRQDRLDHLGHEHGGCRADEPAESRRRRTWRRGAGREAPVPPPRAALVARGSPRQGVAALTRRTRSVTDATPSGERSKRVRRRSAGTRRRARGSA